jgi:hypothetical protein
MVWRVTPPAENASAATPGAYREGLYSELFLGLARGRSLDRLGLFLGPEQNREYAA